MSSGSLTTAATTKGSDFGGQHRKVDGGSSTPQRSKLNIMNEVVMPQRPTNTSRALHHEADRQPNGRKNRLGRGSEERDSKGHLSIVKASQTSIGSNSFARSAMRLK